MRQINNIKTVYQTLGPQEPEFYIAFCERALEGEGEVFVRGKFVIAENRYGRVTIKTI